MCHDHPQDARGDLCEVVQKQNATSLAVAISLRLYASTKLALTATKYDPSNPKMKPTKARYGSVYLASPPSMKEFVANTSRAFNALMRTRGIPYVKIYSLEDLREHSREFYK